MKKRKSLVRTFEVTVEMPSKFDASYLQIALIGMMIKVLGVKEICGERETV